MSGIRNKVAKKTSGFVKKAQQAPMPAPQGQPAMPKINDPGAPGGGAPGGAPKPPAGGAPGVPGAAPPAPPPKDPTADIDHDKREEAKLEKLSEGLSKLEDKFDTLVDAVIEMKDALSGDGKKDRFEEVKEEDDELEDVSSEEFGIEKDNLVLSKKEAEMPSAEDLRTARKQRLAKGKQGKELTFEMDEVPNKKYKQEVPSPTITKVKKAPEDWGQYRMSAMSLDLNASGNQWSLVNMDTGEVYYTLNATDETAETFATEEFAKEIIKDMHELGVEAAMEKHAALPFEKDEAPDDAPKSKLDSLKKKGPKPFKREKKDDPGRGMGPGKGLGDRDPENCGRMAAEEDPVEQAVEQAAEQDVDPVVEESVVEEAAVEEDTGITASDYHRRFMRAFRLALTAQSKNLISNPLKGAVFSVLSELKVDKPAAWVESIFAQAADDHFEVALTKTDEYLELSDEGIIEQEALIGDMETSAPIEDVDDDLVGELRPTGSKAEALKRRARNSSIPLSSSTIHETDRFSDLAGALPAPKLAGIGRFKI